MYIYIYTYYVYILVGYSHGRFIRSPKCHHHRYYDNLPQCKSWPGAIDFVGHRGHHGQPLLKKSGDILIGNIPQKYGQKYGTVPPF